MTWVKADHARDAIVEIEIAQADHCAPAAVFDAIAGGLLRPDQIEKLNNQGFNVQGPH
ncbi:hypothetical protein D3C84_1103080 [compost metagenome]|uniref:hypothetical protein n=1 Tax=Pseudomonas sp. BE134 TaxID=2817843 RepID=UPI000F9CF557|nr:hypothetical protein [Pseudomonas sp. BE134]MDR6924351.1 hypothetical protein [Pseudomonas sp. BE134]